MNGAQTQRLTIVIDRLIPGDGAHWPAAGQHGLADRVAEQLRQMNRIESVLKDIIDALPPNFEALPIDEQEALMKTLETNHPNSFDALVTATYNMYYTDPAIRRIIEQLTGYPARPPQPDGYEMAPFDESMLDRVRQLKPFWRRD